MAGLGNQLDRAQPLFFYSIPPPEELALWLIGMRVLFADTLLTVLSEIPKSRYSQRIYQPIFGITPLHRTAIDDRHMSACGV